MKQKTAEQKRTRRRRYIDAIEPFRQQYNCAAGQVHGIIRDILSENQQLKSERTKLLDRAGKAEQSLVLAEAEVKNLRLSLDQANEMMSNINPDN